jgi:channel protein (hemolysin III family)
MQHAYFPHEAPAADEEDSWRIADFGHVGERSRDGSFHATDEVFNAASHLVALMLSILGSSLLIVDASARGEPWKIVSFSIYGASLCFLFGASTLHHAIVGQPHVEDFLRMLDYLAIYPLISGTFTPLCLVFYNDAPVGWTFIATVWALAIIGMIFTACCFAKLPKWLSMTLYVSLGWLGAVREISGSAAELVPFVDTATSHVFAPFFLHANHLTMNRFRQYPTVLFLLAPSRFRNVWFRALFAGRTSVYGRRICLYDRTTQPVRMR